LKLAPWCVTGNPYSAIAPYAVSLSMSVSMSMSVSVSVSVLVFLYLSVYMSMSIKYSATNIFLQDPDYSVNFQGPYEVAQKFKGPLTWEGLDQISWNSRRLSFKERSIGWYHFQPNKSRKPVPLTHIHTGSGNQSTWLEFKAV
jgi:hypothetical protein